MSYLVDTNVISEIRKGGRCDSKVSAWYSSIDDQQLFLSTLVLGEIRKGIELARPRDPGKAVALERWLHQVEAAFGARILGIDDAVSDLWGRMSALRPIPVIDGLLAATAAANDLTLVTRNDRNVAGLGARILNPFRGGKSVDYHCVARDQRDATGYRGTGASVRPCLSADAAILAQPAIGL